VSCAPQYAGIIDEIIAAAGYLTLNFGEIKLIW
jgi:hypothetical protein